MELVELFQWLKIQAPVIVVMGIVIWWLAKRLVSAEERNKDLTENVIKIATLWEIKSQSLSDDDKQFKKEINDKLTEVVAILKNK